MFPSFNFIKLSNSSNQCPLEANTRSADQKIRCPKDHYNFHKTSPLGIILTHNMPTKIRTFYSLEVRLNSFKLSLQGLQLNILGFNIFLLLLHALPFSSAFAITQ
jgi:hypothetical protein